MPGPNVLDLVGDIREAVERLPKDQLVDILVYVFKEYVVEGSPPLAAGPGVAVQDDLAGMSFAEVVRSLQLRLDLPELELFDVQGARVSIRLQGRSIPIEVGAARAEPGPPPAPPPPAAAPPAPSAPAPAARAPAAAPVPAPAARPAGPAAPQQNAPAATQQPAAVPSSTPAASPTASQQPAVPGGGGGRNGLLEID